MSKRFNARFRIALTLASALGVVAGSAPRLVFKAFDAVEPVGAVPPQDRVRGDGGGIPVDPPEHVLGHRPCQVAKRRAALLVQERRDDRVPPEREF